MDDDNDIKDTIDQLANSLQTITLISTRLRRELEESAQQPIDLEAAADKAVHVILRGPFGTVYSEKTCFFHLPIENYGNDINVHLYGKGLGEPPATSHPAPRRRPSRTSA
jgi:hypothetical protein